VTEIVKHSDGLDDPGDGFGPEGGNGAEPRLHVGQKRDQDPKANSPKPFLIISLIKH
jgi:hypothetical protein